MPWRSRFARISRVAVAVPRADAVVVATVSRHARRAKPVKAVAMVIVMAAVTATVARAKAVMPGSRVTVPMVQAVMVNAGSSAMRRVPPWQRTAAVMAVPMARAVAAVVMAVMAVSAAIKPRNPASVRAAAVAVVAQASVSKDNAQARHTKGRVETVAMARTHRAGKAGASVAILRNAVRVRHAEMASGLPC